MRPSFSIDKEGSNEEDSGYVEPPEFPKELIKECKRVRARVFFPKEGRADTVDDVIIPTNRYLDEDDSDDDSEDDEWDELEPDQAYIILHPPDHRTTFGKVSRGLILQRRPSPEDILDSHVDADALPSPTLQFLSKFLPFMILVRICPLWYQYVEPLICRFLPFLSYYDCVWEVVEERYCAVKEMDWEAIRNGQKEQSCENPLMEMAAMQFLERRRMAKSLAVFTKFNMNTRLMYPLDVLGDEKCLYCMMPYMDQGDLFDVLKQTEDDSLSSSFTSTASGLSESLCRYWFREILLAVEEMHKIGICHRDLSLENIMVGPNKTAMIIDWGLCLRMPYKTSVNRDRYPITRKERCGKYAYMSPEVYNSINDDAKPYDTRALDLWSVGVILLILALGDMQWDMPDPSLDERFELMTSGELANILRRWNMGLSEDLMDLLQGMLMVDPQQRLTLDQILEHPWMAQ